MNTSIHQKCFIYVGQSETGDFGERQVMFCLNVCRTREHWASKGSIMSQTPSSIDLDWRQSCRWCACACVCVFLRTYSINVFANLTACICCVNRATLGVWTAWNGTNAESKSWAESRVLCNELIYVTSTFYVGLSVIFVHVLFSLLASGSDDQHCIIWDPFKHKKLTTMHTGHAANIFSVKVKAETAWWKTLCV